MSAGLEVVSVAGPAWVQDLGRPGHMHEAVPVGGALAPPLLIAANAAVGNAPQAAGIEYFGSLRVRALHHALQVSADGAKSITLEPGAEAAFVQTSRAVAYLAVAGGIDVPVVLGGRGTLPVAALGGYEGRALRRGDRLAVSTDGHAVPRFATAALGEGPIAVVEGPDGTRFPPQAFEALLGQPWHVATDSDRAGLRLRGEPLPVLPAARAPSMPMVQGAIQVPPSGQPVILGPDHPTTGGYPVIAYVLRAGLARAFTHRAGSALRFRPATPDEAKILRLK